MHKTITGNQAFEIVSGDEGFVVNGQPFQWDLATVGKNYFHILHENKSYRAEFVKADQATKTVTLKINGHLYDVVVKDKIDLLLEKMGMNNMNAGRVNNVKAPMPGLIVDLKIKDGDTVQKNDPLLVLEAMKMENVIKSPGDGVVRSIRVKKGDSVDKNQILIEF